MNTLALVGIGIAVYMTCWYILSMVIRRADIADIAWGMGFIMVAWYSFFMSRSDSWSGILIPICVTLWGSRLAYHIFMRNKDATEDYRYAQWRQDWGSLFWIRSYVQIFLLQGCLLFLIALPLITTNAYTSQYGNIFMVTGFWVWCLGFCFEIVGDAQLADFKKDPTKKGTILESGLWRYSRHPNYFGEVTLWWGIWIMSLVHNPSWWTIIGPLTITFLILYVSGIPMLEKKLRQKPGFAEYSRRVSKFFPLPPKK